MLVIGRDFDNRAFEEAIRAVHSEESGTIRIPHKILTKDLGGSARLLQLLATWSRIKTGGATLKLYSEDMSEPGFASFATTPFGLASLIFCDTVHNSKGEEVVRRDALKYSVDYVRTMHSGPLIDLRNYNKSSLPIICIDGAKTLRRPARLYVGDTDVVRGKSDFSNLTRACFEAIQTIGGVSVAGEDYNDIAHLIHEAFLNTHEHAQDDAWGRPYIRSIRGISISFRDLNSKILESSSSNIGSVASYLTSFKLKKSNLTQARFAEVSIFDSGPGLALNWLKKNNKLTPEIDREMRSEFGDYLLDELKAVQSCLIKGATTKGRESRGMGMFRMMQVIKKTGGFISIRSGRLSLAKHFEHPSAEVISDAELDLVDLDSGSVPDKALPRVEGTVISALIPLNRG
jgi:hypothetical protein